MTNKQMIINGIDVSGCDFLAKEDDYYSYSGEYRAYKGQCGCSDEEMCKDHPNCFYKRTLKQLKAKEQENNSLQEQVNNITVQSNNAITVLEQEYEELRKYHNKCCEEFENEKQKLIDKYNQFSKDFFIGKYCKKEYCELLKAKEEECEELKKELEVIYDDCKGCPTCNEALHNANLYAKEYRKLKQTLSSIKNIAEEDFNHTCWETYNGQLEQILQKISETEND